MLVHTEADLAEISGPDDRGDDGTTYRIGEIVRQFTVQLEYVTIVLVA